MCMKQENGLKKIKNMYIVCLNRLLVTKFVFVVVDKQYI